MIGAFIIGNDRDIEEHTSTEATRQLVNLSAGRAWK